MKPDFDLIVIGAGINGAGIARDAAMRGLKVLLIDKADIGGGTSAGSTRLIHGGLRYLEHFEFGLVRESLRERETLLKIAPHLVRPLPITIPIYKSSKRGRTTIKAGMIAYDLLSAGKSLPPHRMQSAAETLMQFPGLNPQNLRASAAYFDAQVEFAERLVFENVLAAVQNGAAVHTYTRIVQFLIEDATVKGVEFVCEDGKSASARAGIVANAAGPWVDQSLQLTHTSNDRLIGGTKGSHIIVAPFAGAPRHAVYLEAASDGRPFFIIPWNGNYLIGTTDVRFEGDPDEVRAQSWEIDYLLAETNCAFPAARLTREHVAYTYSAVRPLPFTANHDEQRITRRHFIREHPQFKNLISIVGGKLTTYRSLAEECVDLIFRKLGRQSPACMTAQTALPGATDEKDLDGFPAEIGRRLVRVYGSRAREVVELARSNEELSRPFNKNANAVAAEIVFAFEREFAKHLTDCFLRRTMIGLNADLGFSDIEAAASIAQRFLGWSEQRAQCEVQRYRDEISRFIIRETATS